MKRLVWALLAGVIATSGYACANRKAAGKYGYTSYPPLSALSEDTPQTGADRLEEFLPLLKGKRIAVFANHTSMVGGQNLVDTLHKRGITISVVFGPEHGFRGTADAGEKVSNYTDRATGIPVVSLYGSKRRPSAEDLKNVDLMIFDIQDVGTRFYTYISSLEEYMIAAFENQKPLLILDRPNPNAFYVDGPVLDTAFRSFVGMQPVPIVYGMTIGEYALMLIGEKWLKGNFTLKNLLVYQLLGQDNIRLFEHNKNPKKMMIVPCSGYNHSVKYELPVKPSPNLPDINSIYCYPSTCFFEGTVLSEGRGTEMPFRTFGHPSLPKTLFSFTPRSMPGATSPKLKDQLCYGWKLDGTNEEILEKVDNRIQLQWLLEAYRQFPQKDSFFLTNGNFFNKLAGNADLQRQLKEGKSEAEIRASWEPALTTFKAIRKKYLLYQDF
ncbi:MAG: exo-beta-N-acetylmuramidase NamZ family protein [Pseudobacter sp.]|uniref:exo-beta-N-acetylmuramidase NamZ family protein n=1 Tax=Pseudobacter sp. TaxID=2045420 RepID=UPI003F7E1726